jgi:GNAT superfamily N-acetyltransferase
MSAAASVRAEPVRTKADYTAFVDLPWRVPMDRPLVRPMLEFQRHLFDRGRRFRSGFSLSAMLDSVLLGKENPFYEHGDLELFLAKDAEGRPVARLVAIENRLHNEYHHDRTGFFGFYECVDGGAAGRTATAALVDAARGWLRSRGLESIRGPFNPTINDDCGIWTDGDSYPAFLMPSNPRYYADLLQAAGLSVVKTMRVYRRDFRTISPDQRQRWHRIAQRIQRGASNVTIRSANFKQLDDEVKAFVSIFNQAWAQNWGFAPMSFRELYSMAELFQSLVDPNLIRAAEIEENGVRKVVGVMITIPDLNEFLRHTGGRLIHPLTLWHLLRMKLGTPTRRVRIAILGVLPEYRHTPVSILLLYDAFQVAEKFGAQEMEASWILEDNVAMVRPLEDYAFQITDHYVIFEGAV